MSIAINCGYARVALRGFVQNHTKPGSRLPTTKKEGELVLDDYNQHFKDYPNIQLPKSVLKRIPGLMKSFNKKWRPGKARSSYLTAFSKKSWDGVEEKEKKRHRVKDCHVCETKYQSLNSAFPAAPAHINSTTTITFSSEELLSPRKLGRKVLGELSPICQGCFGTSPQEVLEMTPKSRLVTTPTAMGKQVKKRKIIREVKSVLQDEMDQNAATSVMRNRISWSSYVTVHVKT